MLQADEPDDFVIATGTSYTVRDFVQISFDHVGLDWEKYVRFDERYLRPTEVDDLIGDASKAERILGWKPQPSPPTSPASWSTPTASVWAPDHPSRATVQGLPSPLRSARLP